MSTATSKIKYGVYGIGLLMMGVIAISSSLATIAAQFPGASQTMIQNLISVSCIVIIPTTIVVGKLMEYVSKKSIVLVGIVLFLVGGTAPAFMTSFDAILIMRAVLGIGVGICQVISTALVVEQFRGPEQNKVQGTLQASQMFGIAIMVFLGGALADFHWNDAFFVHLLGVVSLILVAIFVPHTKPRRVKSVGTQAKMKFTGVTWGWIIFMFFLFITFQIYNVSLSFLIAGKKLGTAADAGLSVAFFALGGFVMGLFYEKLANATRNCATAVGCVCLVISFVLVATAHSMLLCYIGSVFFGVAIASTLPGVFINTGMSVEAGAMGMAISAVTCSQNFAQFVCPFLVNPLSEALSPGNNVVTNFVIGAILAGVLAVIMFAWGTSQNKKKLAA